MQKSNMFTAEEKRIAEDIDALLHDVVLEHDSIGEHTRQDEINYRNRSKLLRRAFGLPERNYEDEIALDELPRE